MTVHSPHPDPPPLTIKFGAKLSPKWMRVEGSYGRRDAKHPFSRKVLPPSPQKHLGRDDSPNCGEGGRGLGLVLLGLGTMNN
jgi:hypothetical protein